ncbi:hypothetical protein NA57DRAFT_76976 [Rhizodiscina lignyota]|uniref:DBF4-type domain-containing protein n=1 Tax=Rhizodiscina lignyota TaxID=1504668 RepID=A0A9P4IEH7_9PEZI|nr:hypothetical protein NA57DRAFT_76976 [Rhizodiscina lignyota]
MAGRRVPLADVPNAANSPFRAVTVGATAGKRPRPQSMEQRELVYGQPPPSKRQVVETEESIQRRNILLKRVGKGQPTTLQRKLEAAREPKPTQQAVDRQQYNEQTLEHIRQWQNHYKKVFPSFVFYLDSIPSDMKGEVLSGLHALGARDDKFFSKSVTHVITTRPIPPVTSSSSSEAVAPQATINPSVLDRSQDHHGQAKGKFSFEPPRKAVDVLQRARDLGMKIWALEKLQRIMMTMFDTSTGEGVRHGHDTRTRGASTVPHGQPDLSTLLQQEKLHGPADRDVTVAVQEMTQFRGYYIYVHDMDEQTKPVMVRDYAKPERKEDGQWPQLRATPAGRCPFVDDQASARKLKLQQAKAKQKMLRDQTQATAAPRTRAAFAMQQAREQKQGDSRILTENNNLATRRNHAAATVQNPNEALVKPLDPPKTIPAKRGSTDTQNLPPPLFGSAQASLRQLPRIVAGEPIASGVQPSNVTSAIKSQMISSTAAAPGARAGTSREVTQLKRKVFAKNSAQSTNSIPSSYMNDVRAAINNDRPVQRKRKAEQLVPIDEDMEDEEEEVKQKVKATRKKKAVERELKPGYCENCQDKFNDFEEHILSKKHRKFATTADNWTKLDQLLTHLIRI